jgi:maltose alpha-D-glucosyltransferase/alpha-amylase
LVQVDYTDGVLETYVLPLTFATGDKAEVIRRQFSGAILVGLKTQSDGEQGILYHALWYEGFSKTLLDVVDQ